jgi:tetratricopeptide (TPR) repeat protein
MVLESSLQRDDRGRLVLDNRMAPLAIPETLQDSLMARLDRLGEAKEVAQLGATVGREFSHSVVAAVSALRPELLSTGLNTLVESGLLYRRGFGATERYVFKHALIQDAAYNSLLRSTRGRFHRLIAEALIAQFPEVAEGQPEVVAHHYTEARLAMEAVGWWKLAGSLARTRRANVEAVAHLNRGLELLASLPASAERDGLELALAAALIAPLSNVDGYSAPLVEQTVHRVIALAEGREDPPELVPALWGAFTYHLVAGTGQTLYWGEQTLAAALKRGNTGQVCMGHYAVCVGSWHGGDLARAEEHAKAGRELFDKERVLVSRLEFSFDPGENLNLLAIIASNCGRYSEAQGLALQAIESGRESLQADTYAFALTVAAWLAVWRRDIAGAVSLGAEAVSAAENGGRSFLPWAMSSRGWGKIAGGDVVSGVSDIEAAIRIMDAFGFGFRYYSILAESFLLAGDHDRAEAVAVEGIVAGGRGVERALLADCHRIRGRCLLYGADAEGAEREFLSAVEVAHSHGALAFELRAARDLARLWQSQGKVAEARALLEPVYDRFTEGFDILDLKESRALLDLPG